MDRKMEAFYIHGYVHRGSVSITVQQDATFYTFYSLQTALHVSADNFTHHSLLVLLVMGEGITRNM
jgi:hypothetical protein